MKKVNEFESALDIANIVFWMVIGLVAIAAISFGISIPNESKSVMVICSGLLVAFILYVFKVLLLGIGYTLVQISKDINNSGSVPKPNKINQTKHVKTKSIETAQATKAELDLSAPCKYRGCSKGTYSSYNDEPLCDKHAPK